MLDKILSKAKSLGYSAEIFYMRRDEYSLELERQSRSRELTEEGYGLRVRVSKPGALSYAKNVSVEVKMRRKDNLAKTYIALGSNISPEENIKKALKLLKERLGALKISTVYLTKPLPPFISQPNFYNCVVETNASLDP
ncbi:hypothetical protein DJ526_08925, partial [Sulfolobus sp. A20-N-G8]